MSQWPSLKARLVLAVLLRIGWRVKRQTGSHRTLTRPDRTGRTWCLRFTTGKKSARRCWHGLPSRPAFLRRTYNDLYRFISKQPLPGKRRTQQNQAIHSPGSAARQTDTVLNGAMQAQNWGRMASQI
ncbi:type II toxin-antitoxin system HicA family toxin [Acidithiobacillus sp.]|uniref:type II toxin-antitoxin system HicA family toxin n=1 Tax=Acidithiobacillus sp. TaxID=1872118 RepID=UPI003D082CB7